MKPPAWVTAGYVPESAASRSAQWRTERIARRIRDRYRGALAGRGPWIPGDLRSRLSALCSAFCAPISWRPDSAAGLAARIRRVRSEFRSLVR